MSATAVVRGWGAAAAIAVRAVGVVIAILVVVQALIVVEARPQDLITGFHGMVDIIRRATPPDFSRLPDVAWPALETVDIAIFGTLGGVIMALPLAVLAAVNVTPSRVLYYLSRGVIGFTRAVPDLVWALLFVTAVGLGPFAGMLALGIHTGGVLAKLLSETIESIEPGQVEGVAATGAGRLHVIAFGVVPQVMPNFLSYVMLRFESDIRSASVIGMVGGGGIGFYLWDTIRSFKDREAATVILLIVAMVMLTDIVSSRVRRAAI